MGHLKWETFLQCTSETTSDSRNAHWKQFRSLTPRLLLKDILLKDKDIHSHVMAHQRILGPWDVLPFQICTLPGLQYIHSYSWLLRHHRNPIHLRWDKNSMILSRSSHFIMMLLNCTWFAHIAHTQKKRIVIGGRRLAAKWYAGKTRLVDSDTAAKTLGGIIWIVTSSGLIWL